ncbi:MAG: hypothetical protein IPH16_08980 [Haliscomenobacter sp.]|nr:hypothetical protein [Haliscomenobacter sp.]
MKKPKSGSVGHRERLSEALQVGGGYLGGVKRAGSNGINGEENFSVLLVECVGQFGENS